MMTRKDYEKAVQVVRNIYNDVMSSNAECVCVSYMTEAFVQFFRGDNPRFDADRFRKACKGETGIRGGKR